MLITILTVGFMPFSPVYSAAQGAETKVILRMDDEGFGRHGMPDDGSGLSDAALTRAVVEVVARHNAKLTIAVIPNVVCGSPSYRPEHPKYRLLSSAPDEVAALREAIATGCAEVVLHGWTHEVLTEYEGHASEFGGRPFEEQCYRLAEGKRELEQCLGTSVDVFVPPFNNHDAATLRALRASGLRCISSAAKESDDVDELLYVPGTTTLKRLVETAPEGLVAGRDALINVVFHPNDFSESGSQGAWLSLADFDAFLARMANDPRIQFTTIAEEVRHHERDYRSEHSRLYALYRTRVASAANILDLFDYGNGPFLSLLPPTDEIFPALYIRRAITILLLMEIGAAVALFAVGAFAAHGTMRLLPSHSWLWARAIVVFLGAVSLIFFFAEGMFGIMGSPGFGIRLLLAMSGCGGCLVGALVRRDKKQPRTNRCESRRERLEAVKKSEKEMTA